MPDDGGGDVLKEVNLYCMMEGVVPVARQLCERTHPAGAQLLCSAPEGLNSTHLGSFVHAVVNVTWGTSKTTSTLCEEPAWQAERADSANNPNNQSRTYFGNVCL